MKKIFGVMVLVGAIGLPLAYAANEADSVPAKPQAVDQTSRDRMRKLVEEKKVELNGSEWKVKLTVSSDLKARPEEDVLTFQNGQVRSKAFSDRGFVPTNYTITVPEGDEMTVWETMQTSPKDGVVFIRGEWKDDQMRGIVSQQMEGGKTKDYTFTTESKVAVPLTSEKKEDAKSKVSESASASTKNLSSNDVVAVKSTGSKTVKSSASKKKQIE